MSNMEEKKNAERYLVVARNHAPATVWSESFADVLQELEESAKLDGLKITDDDILMIVKLDY